MFFFLSYRVGKEEGVMKTIGTAHIDHWQVLNIRLLCYLELYSNKMLTDGRFSLSVHATRGEWKHVFCPWVCYLLNRKVVS